MTVTTKQTTPQVRRLTAPERRYLISKMDWIKLLYPQTVKCDAYKWHAVRLKNLYVWGPRDNPKPPTGMEDKRCTHWAVFHFSPLKRSNYPARAGNYCMIHVASEGLYYNDEETKRTTRWDRGHRDHYLAEFNERYTKEGLPRRKARRG